MLPVVDMIFFFFFSVLFRSAKGTALAVWIWSRAGHQKG